MQLVGNLVCALPVLGLLLGERVRIFPAGGGCKGWVVRHVSVLMLGLGTELGTVTCWIVLGADIAGGSRPAVLYCTGCPSTLEVEIEAGVLCTGEVTSTLVITVWTE